MVCDFRLNTPGSHCLVRRCVQRLRRTDGSLLSLLRLGRWDECGCRSDTSLIHAKMRSRCERPSAGRILPIARLNIALLTGGGDKPYALGLAEALASNGVSLDFVGSDDLDDPELRKNPDVRFLNLRGDQRPDVS